MSSTTARARSVQATRIRLEVIEAGVAHFEGGHCCAAVELGGADVDAGDEDQQEVIVAGLGAFLNALAFPVQLLVRAQPIDLRRYLERLEDRARSGELNQALAELARDQATFVRGLARQRTLLERHFYVVVPARTQQHRASGPFARLPRLLGRTRAEDAGAALDGSQAGLVR